MKQFFGDFEYQVFMNTIHQKQPFNNNSFSVVTVSFFFCRILALEIIIKDFAWRLVNNTLNKDQHKQRQFYLLVFYISSYLVLLLETILKEINLDSGMEVQVSSQDITKYIGSIQPHYIPLDKPLIFKSSIIQGLGFDF